MSGDNDDEEYLKALEIQRRNFEAQFGSIEDMGFKDKSKTTPTTDEQQDDSEFEGFDSDNSQLNISSSDEGQYDSSDSEQEEEVKPKVIKLNSSTTTSSNNTPTISKTDKKLLKSGRAPTLTELATRERLASQSTSQNSVKDTDNDNEDLANDLKLQRLLKESHILANTLEYSGVDVTLQTMNYDDPVGKARRRTLTSRMREISSVNSSGAPKRLESMPMNMRKGMIRKREERVRKYEEEARNAGIVLSKVKKGEIRDLNAGKGSTLASDRIGNGKKVVKRVRDRGLKIHGIGKATRNGLVISQNEINRINSSGGSGGHRRGKKGRRYIQWCVYLESCNC
ncbi:Protein FAF1 [Candida viswanathii]|uniref:Protein FAF1 n=1 Tax=Candida viswanathii TaxID=5486 RepID=A0A367XPS9_9ASCO|nr:Protein FAF1 [Candida viswanathii]